MEFNALTKLITALGLSLCLSSCGTEDKDTRVTISTGDTIIALNDLQYQLPVVVQVADLSGSPQANAIVSINLKTLSFDKGQFTYQDTDGDAKPDKWVQSSLITCAAEDANNNGILDAGEDSNGNGLLDPRTPSITSHPSETPTLLGGTSTIFTDDNGFGYFTLSYPKTEGSWVTVELTATADDGLAENIGKSNVGLFVLNADLESADDPPAFVASPYGKTANCNTTI